MDDIAAYAAAAAACLARGDKEQALVLFQTCADMAYRYVTRQIDLKLLNE